MHPLLQALDESDEYPTNMRDTRHSKQWLQNHYDRLKKYESTLFYDPQSQPVIEVDTVRCMGNGSSFKDSAITSKESAKAYLRNNFPTKDPKCQFIFFHAKHSRAKLKTTRAVFAYTLSYLQVEPTFLEFLYSFGELQRQRDSNFSGCYGNDPLSQARPLSFPEIGRSGRRIELSYSLKAIEPSGMSHDPWSMRQTAVYHSFDLEFGNATWVMVKGNALMRNRVKDAVQHSCNPRFSSFGSLHDSFSSSLEVHSMICTWSAENWRWYISRLENMLQKRSSRTITLPINAMQPPALQRITRMQTFGRKSASHLKSITVTAMLMEWYQNLRAWKKKPTESAIPLNQTQPRVGVHGLLSHSGARQEEYDESTCEDLEDVDIEIQFFEDLQSLEDLEAKANTALLAVSSNCTVLAELQRYYQSLTDSPNWSLGPPATVDSTTSTERSANQSASDCKNAVAKFEKLTTSVINDLKMQQGRIEALLRTVTGIRNLISSILQYRNMRDSKMLAHQAQRTADRMNHLTYDMHRIAKRTEHETISMRIMAFATVIFLPSTFICALMSTDVVQFSTTPSGQSRRKWARPAVEFFVEFAIPLTICVALIMTFMTIYVKWAGRRKDEVLDKEQAERALAIC